MTSSSRSSSASPTPTAPTRSHAARGRAATSTRSRALNASIGSPNEGVPYFAGNSCYLPRIASMACMIGDACVMDCSQFFPKRYDDPRYTVPEYCIIWGHQPFYANADGFYGHWIIDLMKRGMKVAVVDPNLTWIAARAGEDWLRVRPGGDGALAMAMLKVICDERPVRPGLLRQVGLRPRCGVRARHRNTTWTSSRRDVGSPRRTCSPRRAYATQPPSPRQSSGASRSTSRPAASRRRMHSLPCGRITGNLDVPGGNVIGRACWGIEQPNWTGTWGYDELLHRKKSRRSASASSAIPMFAVGFKNMSSNATIEQWQNGGHAHQSGVLCHQQLPRHDGRPGRKAARMVQAARVRRRRGPVHDADHDGSRRRGPACVDLLRAQRFWRPEPVPHQQHHQGHRARGRHEARQHHLPRAGQAPRRGHQARERRHRLAVGHGRGDVGLRP